MIAHVAKAAYLGMACSEPLQWRKVIPAFQSLLWSRKLRQGAVMHQMCSMYYLHKFISCTKMNLRTSQFCFWDSGNYQQEKRETQARKPLVQRPRRLMVKSWNSTVWGHGDIYDPQRGNVGKEACLAKGYTSKGLDHPLACLL